MSNFFTEEKNRLSSGNIWIIISMLFFISWKFFLIGVLWEGRSIPPVPDDAYTYVSNIDSVRNCPTVLCNDDQYYSLKSYTGFAYLSYRILGGLTGKIFDVNSLHIFKYLFFLGTILLVFSLLYFLKNIEANKKLVAFSLFFLALFNGIGFYHGFWWVVPSFFSTVIFFLILGVFFHGNDKYWQIKVWFLSLALLLTHPIGIYILLSLPLLGLFYWLLNRENARVISKKIFFTFICSLFFYLPLTLYLHSTPEGNPYGPEEMILTPIQNSIHQTSNKIESHEESLNNEPEKSQSETLETPAVKQNLSVSDFDIVRYYYFSWIFFPFYIGLFIFLFIIFALFYYQKTIILAVYFYILSLVLMATLFEYGSRLLILLWPITFILVAFGIVLGARFIEEHLSHTSKKISLFALSMFACSFIVTNLLFSYLWNDYTNKITNPDINDTFISYLKNEDDYRNANSFLFFNSKLALTFSLNDGIEPKKVTSTVSEASYFITIDCPDIHTEIEETRLFRLFTILRKSIPGFNKKSAIDKENTNTSCNDNMPSNFIFQRRFGNVLIYKREVL